ncbi:MAG: hypothetical protein WC547_03295 [Candidatus Omnitrophota bacterium]
MGVIRGNVAMLVVPACIVAKRGCIAVNEPVPYAVLAEADTAIFLNGAGEFIAFIVGIADNRAVVLGNEATEDKARKVNCMGWILPKFLKVVTGFHDLPPCIITDLIV